MGSIVPLEADLILYVFFNCSIAALIRCHQLFALKRVYFLTLAEIWKVCKEVLSIYCI